MQAGNKFHFMTMKSGMNFTRMLKKLYHPFHFSPKEGQYKSTFFSMQIVQITMSYAALIKEF
jgi:hypothetical protein